MGAKKTRQKILKNLHAYSPEELAEAVRDDIVSLYELSKTGDLSPLTRHKIEELLFDPQKSSTEESKNTITWEPSKEAASKETVNVNPVWKDTTEEKDKDTKPIFETQVTPSPPAFMAAPLSPAPMPYPPAPDPDTVETDQTGQKGSSSPILPPPFPG